MSLYLTDYLLDAKPLFFFKEEQYYCYYSCIKIGTSYSLVYFLMLIKCGVLMNYREALISKVKSTYKEITGSSS